jgi:hypothetical protein
MTFESEQKRFSLPGLLRSACSSGIWAIHLHVWSGQVDRDVKNSGGGRVKPTGTLDRRSPRSDASRLCPTDELVPHGLTADEAVSPP